MTAHAKVTVVSQADIQVTTGVKSTLIVHRELPFRWDFNFPGENGSARYTLTLPPFVRSGDARPMAIMIPRVGNQVQVYLNGYMVDARSQLSNSKDDAAKEPFLIIIPTALLHTSYANTLVIDTMVQSLRWGGLSKVYYGYEEELRGQYVQAYWLQQSSYIVILSALVLMGLISLALWLGQRESLYGLFALSALWGSFSAATQFSITSWIPWPLQGIVASVGLAWYVVFMTRFTLGAVGEDGAWVKLALLATALAVGIAFILAEPVYWTIAVSFLSFPIIAALIFTAKAVSQNKSKQARLLFALSLIVTLVALRDLFVVHIPESGIEEFALLPHALFLYVLMMGWLVVERYTLQNKLYHNLSITLEDRVKERETQLEKSFEEIKVQSEERVRLVERQRIMSDIHDGVGGQLVALVNMIKRGHADPLLFDRKQLSEHAQMALDELRVAVDAMQPVDGDLATVLATLRYRLEPRLKASGIDLVWRIDELPLWSDLTPQKVLQIQRILLEAFTNVIKHSGAKMVMFTAWHQPAIPSVDIVLQDDGVGFDINPEDSQGHGLGNMSFRANAIGATLRVYSSSGKGTRLSLKMPYQPLQLELATGD